MWRTTIKEKLLSRIDEMEIDWNGTRSVYLLYTLHHDTDSIDFTFELSFRELRTEIFAGVPALLPPPSPCPPKPEPVTSLFTHGEVDGSRAARADNRVSRKNIIISSANRPSRSNAIPLRLTCRVSARWYYIQDRFESHRINSCLLLLLHQCDPDRAHGSHGKVTRS